jgi:hypothetical protein
MTLSSKLALAGVTLACGVAAAFAIAPAPGQSQNQPKCELPSGPPDTSSSVSTDSGTGPVTSGPGGGPPPDGGKGITQVTEGPGGGQGGPYPPSSTGTGPAPPSSTEQRTANGCPPGPTASPADKASVYGKYCKGQSRKRVGRESPYTKCLTAMARLALSTLEMGAKTTPPKACKAESRQRLAHQRRTPYAMCVKSGRKLVSDLRRAVPR